MDEALAIVRTLLGTPSADASPVVDALFRREAVLPSEVVRRGFGRDAADALAAVGLTRLAATGIVSTARLTRFGGRLIASDRIGFRLHPDFVLGPGPATATLADAVRPLDGGRTLDLGCGPGSLALWLAGRGGEVMGLDISPRALAFAAFNKRLNDVARARFRAGDFLTAPADASLDAQFDVAVANPPFVLAPRTELVYRDGPLPGGGTTRVALERVARALAPGGRGYVIGSWADAGRGRWDARPRHWLRRHDGRAIVTRISSVTPDAYVASWTRDLDAAARPAAAEAWLRYLRGEGVERITTGIVAVARPRRRSWRRGVVERIESARPGWRAIEALLAGA